MVTFYKVCPPALYDPQKGGNRADSLNMLRLVNGSQVLFMNLKDTDDAMVRGLEINSVLVDQAEEISEQMWIMLAARVNRWDRAIIPQYLLDTDPDWPRFPNGNYKPPAYMMGLCNPDSELHWIYRRFHPKSEQFQNKYHTKHIMIEGATTVATIDPELLEDMMENDDSWVDRFVLGKWGIPGGAIHRVLDESILKIGENCEYDFVQKVISQGHLARVLDHGDSAPTCCLWFSAFKGNYYCYREYYKPNALISEHRANIAELSGKETYIRNLIDPQCAKKTMQKYGSRWSHVEEYMDTMIDAPPICWQPGDNNELVTRNRISELLRKDSKNIHPTMGTPGAPKLYFIERSDEWPTGCYHSISQLKAQKREKIGSVEGKDMFSDDREEGVPDHAYDPLRYYVADHNISPAAPKRAHNPNSFMAIRKNFLEYQRNVALI
jgi:hypothetical protein